MKKIKLTGPIIRDLELSYGEKIKLDERDKKILELLSKDGRMTIAELAKEIKLSRDATKYRLDKLIHRRVITGFTAIANPSKIGLPLYTAVLISLGNLNSKKENQLISYMREAPYIIYSAKVMGEWDIWIEVFARDAGHLDEILSDLRQKFSGIIKSVRIVPVVKEYKWKEFPGRF